MLSDVAHIHDIVNAVNIAQLRMRSTPELSRKPHLWSSFFTTGIRVNRYGPCL